MPDFDAPTKEALFKLLESMGRVEGMVSANQELLSAVATRYDGLENRMRSVERRQYWLTGAAAGAGAAIAGVLDIITHGFQALRIWVTGH